MTSAPVSYSTLGAISTVFPVVEYFAEPAEPSVDSFEAGNIVASIGAAFGLSTKDLASILHVDLYTIYAWIRQEQEPSEADCRRLRSVDSLAQRWRTLTTHSANLVLRDEFSNGESILSELQKETISQESTLIVMKLAAQQVNKKMAEQARRMPKGKRPEVSEYDIISLNAFIPK